MIKTYEHDDILQVNIPFVLKDIFKNTFKTAKWNAQCKVWEMVNTKESRIRIEQFKDEVNTYRVFEVIDEVNESPMTEQEIEVLKGQMEGLVLSYRALVAKKIANVDLNNKLFAMKAQIEEKKKLVESEQKEVQYIQRENMTELNEILKLYKFKGFNVHQVLAFGFENFQKYNDTGKDKYRQEFEAIQNFLQNVHNDIQDKFGIDFVLLKECANACVDNYKTNAVFFKDSIFNVKKIKIK